MSTIVSSKRKFINWLETYLKDEDVVLTSQTIDGELKIVKGVKRIPFAFAASAFKKEGVGDIYFGDVQVFSFAVCPQEAVSESTLKIYEKEIAKV